jgi:hypothetical protein
MPSALARITAMQDVTVVTPEQAKNMKAFEPEPIKITAPMQVPYLAQQPISGQQARRERRKKNRKK